MSLFSKINSLQRDSFNIHIKIVEFTAYSWNMIGTFLKTLIQNVSNVLFVIFLNNACSLLERVFDVRLYRLYIFSWSTQNSGRHSWYNCILDWMLFIPKIWKYVMKYSTRLTFSGCLTLNCVFDRGQQITDKGPIQIHVPDPW